jgi:hypothetical protein
MNDAMKVVERWRTVDADGKCFMWEGVRPIRAQFDWMMPLYPPPYARKVFKFRDAPPAEWQNEIHRLPVQRHVQEKFSRTGRARF